MQNHTIFTVYLITNTVNGKRYVGVTCKTIAKRWLGHQRQAKHGTKYLLYHAIRKYGADAFTIEELAVAFDKKTAAALEVTLIAFFDTYGWGKQGYNQTRGGDGVAREWTNEERIKHRERQKICMSRPEVRAKISQKAKGRPGARKGKKNSVEHTAKMVKSRTGFYVIHDGELLSMRECEKRTGIDRETIHCRIVRFGWSIKRALSEPTQEQWTPEELALLGTMPDSQAAKKLGKKSDTVRSARQRHGIAAWRKLSPAGARSAVKCLVCGARFFVIPSMTHAYKRCPDCIKAKRVVDHGHCRHPLDTHPGEY